MATETEQLTSSALETQKNFNLARRIEQRQEQFERDTERVAFEDRIRPIISYARPDLSQYLDETQLKGERRVDAMWTSSPLISLEKASDAAFGNIFSPEGWFEISMAEGWVNEIDWVQKYTQQVQNCLYDAYSSSNYYENLPNVLKDWLSIGQGVWFTGVEKATDKPYYRYCEILRTYFSRGLLGNLIRVHELWVMTAVQAEEFFQTEGVELPDEVAAAAVSDPMKTFTFIHSVAPRTDVIFKGMPLERPREYISTWIQRRGKAQMVSDDPLAGIILQYGYESMPFQDWPYSLTGNETYGRGPFCSGIRTIKSLHSFWKSATECAQRMAGPAMRASQSLKGRVDLGPDGVTWTKDATEVLEQVSKQTNPQGILELIEKCEGQIDDALHLSLFMAMSMVTKEIKVSEVMERIGEKAAALAARIGLGQKRFLDPCHARTLQILRRAPKLDRRLIQPPELAEAIRRGEVDSRFNVVYKGPLELARKQMFNVRRSSMMFSMLEPYNAIDPSMPGKTGALARKIDVDVAVEHVLDDLNFWQDAIRPDKKVREIVQNELIASTLMQQAALAKTGSEVDKNMAGVNAANAKTGQPEAQAV